MPCTIPIPGLSDTIQLVIILITPLCRLSITVEPMTICYSAAALKQFSFPTGQLPIYGPQSTSTNYTGLPHFVGLLPTSSNLSDHTSFDMHLPSIDIEVYPIVPISHGRHSVKSARPRSIVSSSSSPSEPSIRRHIYVSPNLKCIQNLLQKVLRSPKLTVQQAEQLPAHLHQIYVAHLTNKTPILLKLTPNAQTRALRQEKHSLQTQCITLETLHEQTPHLPIPRVLAYDKCVGDSFSQRCLITSYIPGTRLSEIAPHLMASERSAIDHTLGSHMRTLARVTATQFGPPHVVAQQKGSTSWRVAFLTLLECVLRDAEDMLVTIPYEWIRIGIQQRSSVLDEITVPTLVALHICESESVIIDEGTKKVVGLVGFKDVIWGDACMAGVFMEGSNAILVGFGQFPARAGSVHVRMLM
jgi:hypothetical protein